MLWKIISRSRKPTEWQKYLFYFFETYLSFLLSLDLLLLLLLFLMSAPSVGEGGSLFNFVCCCWPLDLSFLPPSPDTFHLNMLLLLLVSRQFIFCFPSNIFSRCRHGGHMLPARAPAGNCGPRAWCRDPRRARWPVPALLQATTGGWILILILRRQCWKPLCKEIFQGRM